MKVITGSAKGHTLKVPRSPTVRPTKNVVKQAIFNIIGDSIIGAFVLDLYSGTGGLGIEALSRGAKHTTFVEFNKEAIEAIKKNLHHTKLTGKAEVKSSDVMKYLGNNDRNFDIVFMDPPYHYGIQRNLFKILPYSLKDEALVVFLHSGNTKTDEIPLNNFTFVENKVFGETTVSFFRFKQTARG